MSSLILQKFESASPEDTESIGAEFAKQLKILDFVSLNGTLGAGKTKFVSGIIRFFCGNEGTPYATSPTYSIMNIYKCGNIAVNHFDFYRLKTLQDVENCGFFDSLEGVANLTVAEWTDAVRINYGRYAAGNYYSVKIKINAKEKRHIEIEKIL